MYMLATRPTLYSVTFVALGWILCEISDVDIICAVLMWLPFFFPGHPYIWHITVHTASGSCFYCQHWLLLPYTCPSHLNHCSTHRCNLHSWRSSGEAWLWFISASCNSFQWSTVGEYVGRVPFNDMYLFEWAWVSPTYYVIAVAAEQKYDREACVRGCEAADYSCKVSACEGQKLKGLKPPSPPVPCVVVILCICLYLACVEHLYSS